jgi:hypothetical protein
MDDDEDDETDDDEDTQPTHFSTQPKDCERPLIAIS